MSGRERRSNEILGASVSLVGWLPDREGDVTEALAEILAQPVPLDEAALPMVVLEKTSIETGEHARALLEAAGGIVEVRDAWVTREVVPDRRARPECPSCGSTRTQPYTFAGPAGRVNMRCTNCGHLFKRA
jgi:hypothetical protein